MSIPVIFENEDLLVLDKPSGVVVHPFDFSNEETVLDFLHINYPQVFSIDNPITLQDKRTINLGGIAHRLDRDTSGVLLVAKNKKTFEDLKHQFETQTIKKTYVALVEGVIEQSTFTIDAPLGRNKKEYKQMVNPKNPRGELRNAVTEVHVLKRNEDTTLVELAPITGRTHQLRAHMSYIEHPIVGDKAYGSTKASERIMLYAASIVCTIRGEEKIFVSAAPFV